MSRLFLVEFECGLHFHEDNPGAGCLQGYIINVWRRGHKTCRCMQALPSTCRHMNTQFWFLQHDPATGQFPVHSLVSGYYRSQFVYHHPDLDCGRATFGIWSSRPDWSDLPLHS